jgi:hypothetical protein
MDGIHKVCVFNLIAKPAAWVDRNVIDGMVKGQEQVLSGHQKELRACNQEEFSNMDLSFFLALLSSYPYSC